MTLRKPGLGALACTAPEAFLPRLMGGSGSPSHRRGAGLRSSTRARARASHVGPTQLTELASRCSAGFWKPSSAVHKEYNSSLLGAPSKNLSLGQGEGHR